MMVAGFGSIFVAAVIAYTHWRQQNKQTKIESARLLLELREQLKQPDFVKVTDNIYAGKASKSDPVVLEKYLNHLDIMASFKDDGLLKSEHIELHAGLFKKVKEDEYVQNFMNELGEDLYIPLKTLLKSL